MMFLAISLLVFSFVILFVTIILIIWWKKYGKTMYFTLKKGFLGPKTTKLPNFDQQIQDFYKIMSKFTKK
jgi:hypothetical protein